MMHAVNHQIINIWGKNENCYHSNWAIAIKKDFIWDSFAHAISPPALSLLNGEDKILHFIMYIYNQSNQASCLYNIRTLMSYTWSSYNSVLFPFNWHKKVLLGYHLTFYTSSSQQDSASDVCSVGYFFLENC